MEGQVFLFPGMGTINPGDRENELTGCGTLRRTYSLIGFPHKIAVKQGSADLVVIFSSRGGSTGILDEIIAE